MNKLLVLAAILAVEFGAISVQADTIRDSAGQSYHWFALEAPRPPLPKSQSSGLLAVSCATRRICSFLEGYMGEGSEQYAVVQHTPLGWNTATLNFTAGIPYGALDGVGAGPLVCRSAGNCLLIADVSVVTDSGVPSCQGVGSVDCSRGRIAQEVKGRWHVFPLPAPSGIGNLRDSIAGGVSCPNLRACIVAGDYDAASGPGAFIDVYGGARWTSHRLYVPRTMGSSPTIGAFSCPRSGLCLAVGHVTRNGQVRGFAAEWTAHGPSYTSIPSPPHASSLFPGWVSCPSSGHCVALDRFVEHGSTGANPDVEAAISVEHRSTWFTAKAPMPRQYVADSSGPQFSVLSCASVGSCEAMGTTNTWLGNGNRQAMLLQETDGRWRSFLVGGRKHPVTCPSAIQVVGSSRYVVAGYCIRLTDWDPRSPVTYPFLASVVKGRLVAHAGRRFDHPFHGYSYGFSDVGCSTRSFCYLAGSYGHAPFGELPLIEQGFGASWRPVKAPLPSDAGWQPDIHVFSVSCWQAGECMAVSNLSVLRLRDGRWTASLLPGHLGQPANYFNSGPSVVCRSAGECVISGFWGAIHGRQQHAYILRRTPIGWDPVAIHPPERLSSGTPIPGSGEIACAELGKLCAATGDYWTGGKLPEQRGMVVRVEGGHVQSVVLRVPRSIRAPSGFLFNAVACGATECAVGGEAVITPSGGPGSIPVYGPVVAIVSHGSAYPVHLPIPRDAAPQKQQTAQVQSIWCSKSESCVAVGSYTMKRFSARSLSREGVFVDVGTGRRWHKVDIRGPAIAPNFGSLLLACRDAGGACLILSSTTGRFPEPKSLFIEGSGSRWHARIIRLPHEISVSGITCTDTGPCIATGTYENRKQRARIAVLSERAGSWSVQTVPRPPHFSFLQSSSFGISPPTCPSPTFCVAVGGYTTTTHSWSGNNLQDGFIEEVR